MPRKNETIGCGSCIYYDGENYECHRCPPQIIKIEDDSHVYGRFPEMDIYEWCGEWKSAKEEEVK